MEVTVRLFAMLRERAGAAEVVLDLQDGARVADALAELNGLADGLPLVMAVNREYADAEHTLAPGDELALIPPVSGGETSGVVGRRRRAGGFRTAPWVRVTAEPLSLDAVAARVRDPRAGAVVTFQGVTREVERLEYEAYAEMAEERLAEIARAAVERHGLCAAAVEHRMGTVPLSEPSVAVAVSAPTAARRSRGTRDHRPGQGRGADLEEGDRGWRGALGGGPPPGVRIRPRAPADETAVAAFLSARGARRVARLGELVDPLDHPALVAEDAGRLAGVATYVPGAERGSC